VGPSSFSSSRATTVEASSGQASASLEASFSFGFEAPSSEGPPLQSQLLLQVGGTPHFGFDLSQYVF
ncbi:UNVERIFIED_CONTAM: hypothetical protein Sindi_1283000, partial [Sesamum indicum]